MVETPQSILHSCILGPSGLLITAHMAHITMAHILRENTTLVVKRPSVLTIRLFLKIQVLEVLIPLSFTGMTVRRKL